MPADAPTSDPLRSRARAAIVENARLGIRAPQFGDDKTWLNVRGPLSLSGDLAGRVVLIDFWTYCCINCMHVLPTLAGLEERYASAPFTVVGCHSAKFANEADADHVRLAVLRLGIAHPVVVDRDFDIWRRYAVSAWPTLVLVGPDGRVLAQIPGEPAPEALDALVAEALAEYGERGLLNPRPLPLRPETAAEFPGALAFPGKVAVDPTGERLAIADTGHHRIVVTSLDGRLVRTFGTGEPGFADGPGGDARFREPQGVTFYEGALLVADTGNHALRRVDLAGGAVTTLAGTGVQGNLRQGRHPGPGTALNSPWDLLPMGDRLLVAMAGIHQLWWYRFHDGTVEPAVGDGSERKADGPFEYAAFAQPSGLALLEGVVYVADSESSSVRAVDFGAEEVSTAAGGNDDPRDLFHFGDEDGKGYGRRFQHPLGIAAGDGVLYVADSYNHKLKTLDPDTREVKCLAGGAPGAADGPAGKASFHEPGGLAVHRGRIYVADTNNHRIRTVDLESRAVATLALIGLTAPPRAMTGAGARSIRPDPLPEVPGTVHVEADPPAVRRGGIALRLRFRLPEGETLLDGAPSQFRVFVEKGKIMPEASAGLVERDRVETDLVVRSNGRIRVEALLYHCREHAACTLSSVRWRVPVTVDEGGTTAIELEHEIIA